MNRKGIELASMTYIILGLVFLFTAVMFSDSIRGVLGPLIDSFGNFAGQSADDKIASSSVQALACAVDVTAYYGIVDPSGGVVDFSKFDSCLEKGELKAPKYVNEWNEEPKDTYSKEFPSVAVSAQISNGKIDADDTSIKYIFENSDIVPDKYTILLKASISQDMPVKDGSIALVSKSPVLCADLPDLKFSGIVKVSFEAKKASGDAAKMEYTCSYKDSVATEPTPQITGGKLITVDGKKAVKFDTSIPDGTATTILYTDGEYIEDYKEDIMFGNKFSGNELSFNVAKINDAKDYSKVTISFQNKNGRPADTATLEITPKNVNQQSLNGNDKSNDKALSGTKVSCGGVDYYLSATNVKIDSADITINFNEGTVKTKTLAPAGSCSDKADNCFVDSSDYTKIKPYKGIEINIKNIISNTVSTKVQCPADDISGMDASITGKLISSSSQYGLGFSQAVIDATKSFGDKITGRATGENKKCFGGSQNRCVVCGTKDKTFSCTVTAFELPQKIRYNDGVFGSMVDYAKAWTGFVGEPYYLAYYETFPEEAAAAWSYDSYDIVWSAIAVSAAMNVGGGALKAVGGSLKDGIIILKSQGLRQAYKKGGKAFEQRLAAQYGGEKALEKVLAAQASAEILGKGEIRGAIGKNIRQSIAQHITSSSNTGKFPVMKEIYDSEEILVNGIPSTTRIQTRLFKMFQDIMTGSDEITDKDIDEIVKAAAGSDKIKAILDTTGNKMKLKSELITLRSEKSDVLNSIDEAALKESVDKVIKDVGNSQALKEFAKKTADDTFKDKGFFEKAKSLYKSKAVDESVLQEKIDDVQKITYLELGRSVGDIENQEVRKALLEKYTAALGEGWDDALKAADDGQKARMTEVFEEAKDRVKNLGGVSSDMNYLSPETKQKVMAISLAATYIGMSGHTLEKYETTCGGDSICLHTPSILTRTTGDSRNYGSFNNFGFPLEDINKQSNLVMLKFAKAKIPWINWAWEGTMRFSMASPCKTDLKIETGRCDCYKYASKDTVLIEAKSGGACTYYTQDGRQLKKKVYAYSSDSSGCCNPSEFEKQKVNTEYTSATKENLEEKLEELSNKKETVRCAKTILSSYPLGYSEAGGSVEKEYSLYASVRPLNLKQNTQTSSDEYISWCEQPFGVSIDTALGSEDFDKRSCVTVEPDTTSMEKYSESGFGENFCFTNPDTAASYIKNGCTVAAIGLSAAIVPATLGTATVVVAIGGGDALCTQVFDTGIGHDILGANGGPWPVSQY